MIRLPGWAWFLIACGIFVFVEDFIFGWGSLWLSAAGGAVIGLVWGAGGDVAEWLRKRRVA